MSRASNFLARNMSPCGDKNFQCLTNSSKSVLLKKERGIEEIVE